MSVGIINSNNLGYWLLGGVVPPSFLQNVQDSVNAGLFVATPRAYTVQASSSAAQWTGAGSLGGWSDTASGFLQASASTNYLIFAIELPYATTGVGTSPTLTGATVRIKPAGAGLVTARMFSINRQNSTSSPLQGNVSTVVSSDGTSNDQILTMTAISPPTIDNTTAYWITVTAGNTGDRIYSTSVQYTVAGY